MKNRFVLIVALIVLVGLVAVPVSAYDIKGYNFDDTPNVSVYVGDHLSLLAENDAACQNMDASWTYAGHYDDAWDYSVLTDDFFDYSSYKTGNPYTVVAGDIDHYISQIMFCNNPSSSNALMVQLFRVKNGTAVQTPVASFTCTPTSQYPDTSIVCTDSSTNTPTDWLWSIDMEGAGIYGWQTHTGQNFTWQSHYPGLYSVNLRANNSAGSDWENKTNYVSISANATPNNCNLPVASGYIRTYAQTNDGMTSGGIYGSQIQMRDMEGGAWSNTTSSEGYWCIDTLPGHSLNLYAQATGYTSTSQLGVSANGGRYYLVLWPDYIPAASAGNVSLYVLVYDQQTGSPLYLSSVRVDGNNINTILKNTGPEGQAVFTIKNQTSIHVTASKAGYNTITRTMTTSNTGPDTLMISLPRSTVTVAPTQTTGPGGTVPTTIGPYGTPGPGGTMAPGYTNNQGQLMMDFLARNGLSLVELCFFVTVLALLGVKLGK
jgi:PKD repeat protein